MTRTSVTVTNPSEYPDGRVASVSEPVVKVGILLPKDYVGTVMELCQGRRGTLLGIDYLSEDRVEFGEISVDRLSHRVQRSGRDIHLGPTEYKLLDHFMQYPRRVFSREQLLDAVWGNDVYVEARTVDVHIGRLRKALNDKEEFDPIRTVRSAGYSLDIQG